MSSTRSGFGIFQPSAYSRGLGASFRSPSLAPPSTHATSVSISCLLSERSSAKCPYCGSANHGGIFLVTTSDLIALAHGRASLYEINENGAISPGRWHSWQWLCRMGATSLWNVTDCGTFAAKAAATDKPNIKNLVCFIFPSNYAIPLQWDRPPGLSVKRFCKN